MAGAGADTAPCCARFPAGGVCATHCVPRRPAAPLSPADAGATHCVPRRVMFASESAEWNVLMLFFRVLLLPPSTGACHSSFGLILSVCE